MSDPPPLPRRSCSPSTWACALRRRARTLRRAEPLAFLLGRRRHGRLLGHRAGSSGSSNWSASSGIQRAEAFVESVTAEAPTGSCSVAKMEGACHLNHRCVATVASTAARPASVDSQSAVPGCATVSRTARISSSADRRERLSKSGTRAIPRPAVAPQIRPAPPGAATHAFDPSAAVSQ